MHIAPIVDKPGWRRYQMSFRPSPRSGTMSAGVSPKPQPALIALLVAFTLNLDQPQWALLTVFIVAQPQSGLVLAKSFYRVIGTVIGAAVALFLVALFAQERVLFLGALALWIGLCTFGSQYARNFAAYSFVLSGYTVAIVGIPGALDAGNAFYIATARVTEISLGIIVTATISHIVLPSSLADSLRQALADAHAGLADYLVSLFNAGDTALLRAKLLGQTIDYRSRQPRRPRTPRECQPNLRVGPARPADPRAHHIDDVPKGVLISSGMTCTVVVEAPTRQWATLAALRGRQAALQ
jgi:uncharacterized membrane protein